MAWTWLAPVSIWRSSPAACEFRAFDLLASYICFVPASVAKTTKLTQLVYLPTQTHQHISSDKSCSILLRNDRKSIRIRSDGFSKIMSSKRVLRLCISSMLFLSALKFLNLLPSANIRLLEQVHPQFLSSSTKEIDPTVNWSKFAVSLFHQVNVLLLRFFAGILTQRYHCNSMSSMLPIQYIYATRSCYLRDSTGSGQKPIS